MCIFLVSIVNTAVGLIIFVCGLIVAVVPAQKLVLHTSLTNPGNSYWFSTLSIVLLALWFILTIIGCSWLAITLSKGQLDTILEFATMMSVIQGFVYGSAGVVIGWLGLKK